jgi:hypothetical protein
VTEAENKEFFRRYVEVVFDAVRHELLPDFVSVDAIDHDPAPDAEGVPILEGLSALLQMRRRAFPDLSCSTTGRLSARSSTSCPVYPTFQILTTDVDDRTSLKR